MGINKIKDTSSIINISIMLMIIIGSLLEQLGGKFVAFGELVVVILLAIVGKIIFQGARQLIWITPYNTSYRNAQSCLLSFFPVMGKKIFIRKSNEAEKVNLLFYKDVAQLSLDEYEKNLTEKYNVNSKAIDCYCQDLINEVIINSLITVRKNNFFKVACLFLSISITIYFISIVCAHVSIYLYP